MNSVELSLFVSRMEAVCDEMGSVLRRTAFSPNIKDRLDFSCALFDARGQLCAQAAHIPVHLGSMAFAMVDLVHRFSWRAGDLVILNDPYLGGTHLPDVTLIAPVFQDQVLIGFAVNRAHHANIGTDTPGSMPLSSSLKEEGIVISPRYLFQAGEPDPQCFTLLKELMPATSPQQDEGFRVSGDIAAQVAAARVGVERMQALTELSGVSQFENALEQLNDYGERLALSALGEIPQGQYEFTDVMDDDGMGSGPVTLKICVTIAESRVYVDFSGTDDQVAGNINCPLAVTAAAVFYVFRCLMPEYTPACSGIFRPISLNAISGSLLNARYPAAVAAGNVETSTRVVDLVLGALQQAMPERIPAASQGTMNNVAMGRVADTKRWDYYETLAGGMGAGPHFPGADARHSHMTNTLNTPVESLEMHYPVRIRRYALRRESGGTGRHSGGDGLIREYEFMEAASVSLLTERRIHSPWGAAGGMPGACGENRLNGQIIPGKTSLEVNPGDRLTIATPGGGGWGHET